jgi:hypothetical protein
LPVNAAFRLVLVSQEKYTARAALGGQFMLNGRCAVMNGRI